MTKFKAGDLVICIDEVCGLVKGKRYVVEVESPGLGLYIEGRWYTCPGCFCLHEAAKMPLAEGVAALTLDDLAILSPQEIEQLRDAINVLAKLGK